MTGASKDSYYAVTEFGTRGNNDQEPGISSRLHRRYKTNWINLKEEMLSNMVHNKS